MICKNCSSDLTALDYYCPNCGMKSGVEARRLFKWSLGCSGIGCSAALLFVAGIYYSVTTNHNLYSANTNALMLAFLTLFALGSALIGVILAIIGFSIKKYRLVRKG